MFLILNVWPQSGRQLFAASKPRYGSLGQNFAKICGYFELSKRKTAAEVSFRQAWTFGLFKMCSTHTKHVKERILERTHEDCPAGYKWISENRRYEIISLITLMKNMRNMLIGNGLFLKGGLHYLEPRISAAV